MAEYDVVVAGGGNNGLTAAAYLAKAGVSVCVVETKPYVGGRVVTREVTGPGFKQDIASTAHIFIQPNPLILNDELKLLSKYGLKYLYPDVPYAVIFPNDRALMFSRDLDKTCASIEKFSKKDAEAYRRFHDWAIQFLDMLTAGMYSPPPPFGAFVSMLDQTEEGQGLLRSLLISGLDITNDWFESDEVKMAMTRFVSEAMMDPQVQGTGFNLFMFIPIIHKYGLGVPVGGSGALSEALARCIEDYGGTIRTSSTIRSFKVEGGEAKGVILDTGEEILAKRAVVTNLSIRQLPEMAGEQNLPPAFLTKVKHLRHASYQAIHQLLTINEAPKYKAGIKAEESLFVECCPGTFEEYMRGFDDYKYGIPVTNSPVTVCWTIIDPSRAPAGKHTLYLYHYEPYNLKGGAARWDEIKQEVADGVLKTLQDHTTNMGKENILGRWISSPLDFERNNPSWVQGDFMHIGSYLHQNLGNRPLPGWAQYRMPIKKLYLCGPSTSPGPGVIGDGRAAVQVVMEDLGIDFEKVIS